MAEGAPLYEHSKEQLCTFCVQNALILKKIMEFKDRIPNSFQEFENFVKRLVDWNPSPDVVYTIWYKAWVVQEKLTGNRIPQPMIDLCADDNDVSSVHHVAGNEVPNEDVNQDNKYHLRSMGPILAAVPYEDAKQDNKYHLRSMGPILAVQPQPSSKLPAKIKALTSNKRKASRNGPQTKYGKKNKKVKDEPLAEE